MKKLVVQPVKAFRGALEIPGDKSVSHRSIILGSLATGTTHVRHFLSSEDCLATLRIFQSMGVRIKRSGDQVTIQGKGLNSLRPTQKILDAGNSGTTARILLGLLAGQPFTSRITGDESLRRRPMKRVVEPLLKMGARISGPEEANFLPLELKTRRLHGITYRLPVASAQVKSALLLAGLFAEGSTTVIEPVATRDHTERMFSAFSIPFRRKGTSITVTGPAAPFPGREIRVPGDISSAAFFITAALLAPGPGVLLRNVGVNPTRTGYLEVLARMGAKIQVRRKAVRKGMEPVADLFVRPSGLKAVQVEGTVVPRMIDEFPVLAVAATQARARPWCETPRISRSRSRTESS